MACLASNDAHDILVFFLSLLPCCDRMASRYARPLRTDTHAGQTGCVLRGAEGRGSGPPLSIKWQDAKQFDAMVEAGNSGGPLIDVVAGQIIGIVSGRFSPVGNGGGIRIGAHALGTESTISYATAISYGLQLMKSERLNG